MIKNINLLILFLLSSCVGADLTTDRYINRKNYIQPGNNKQDLKTVYEKKGKPLLLIDNGIYEINPNCFPDKWLNQFRYYTFILEPSRKVGEMYINRQVKGDSEKNQYKYVTSSSRLDTELGIDNNESYKALLKRIEMETVDDPCEIIDNGLGRKIKKIRKNPNITLYDGQNFYEFINGEIK